MTSYPRSSVVDRGVWDRMVPIVELFFMGVTVPNSLHFRTVFSSDIACASLWTKDIHVTSGVEPCYSPLYVRSSKAD